MSADDSTGDLFAQIGRAVNRAAERFDGATFDPEKDGRRLTAQLEQVRLLMVDGAWRTLHEIAIALHYPEASVSARLRDLRKERFGNHNVERRRIGREGMHDQASTWEYRIAPP